MEGNGYAISNPIYRELFVMYIPGDHWLICDRCGFKTRRSQAQKTWDGLMVCFKDWEPRHPQDYMVKGVPDGKFVVDARPRPADVFRTATGVQQSIGTEDHLEIEESEDPFLTEDGDFLELE